MTGELRAWLGADNTGYGPDAEDDEASRLTALRELRRLLSPDGIERTARRRAPRPLRRLRRLPRTG